MKAIKAISNVMGVAIGLSAAFAVSGCNSEEDADGASASEEPSTGMPAELSEQIDPLTKRLEADAFPGAKLREGAEGKNTDDFATQSTGVPDEVAEAFDRNSEKFEADALSEAGIRVKRADDDVTTSKPESTGIPKEDGDESGD